MIKEKIKAARTMIYILLTRTLIFNWFASIFANTATTGVGSNKCLKKGFLPVPVHFYSAIPDIEELKKRKIWEKKSELSGINFNVTAQQKLLSVLGKSWGQYCRWPSKPTGNSADYYEDNNCFGFGCAAILYSMIRENRPNRIVEIGSGNSSKIIAQAIKEGSLATYYSIVDPYPAEYVKNRKIKFNRLIEKGVEVIDTKVFKGLKKGDILFIDSSHSVKIGSDVNRLILDILPRLNKGVIIHIHDIALPYEYPQAYALNESFRQFWTEQYLLQALLVDNPHFEILLGNCFIMTDMNQKFQKAFPHYDPSAHRATSGGFWFRRV